MESRAVKRSFCFALLAAVAPLGAAQLERGDAVWTLRNAHLVARFDRSHGGVLYGLTDAAGRPYLTSGGIYTDYGLYEERRYLGTDPVDDAELSAEEADGQVRVVARGVCRPRPGDPAPAHDLRYELTVAAAEEPAIELSCAVSYGATVEQASGFLATIFSLPDTIEWAADTVDGRVNERFGGDGRCFQSALLPLDPARPRLQVVYRDGRVLTVEEVRAVVGPLDNVFLHRAGTGVALFFAWLSGGGGVRWEAGQSWSFAAVLRLG